MESILFAILSLGGLGLIFGLLLGYASKRLHVEENPKIPVIRDTLPSANCGACGFIGCEDYATAIVEEGAELNLCAVGGGAVATMIGEIMGVAIEGSVPKKAYVKCQGTSSNAKQKYNYTGPMDCHAVAGLPGGGPKGCMYGCLGLGSCVEACPFDCIHIINGVAVIDEIKCTGCGLCVKTCPKLVIELTPIDSRVRVTCTSKLKGVLDVKSQCSVGCIACGSCERNCPSGAIKLENSLPVIDYEKCTQCDICVEKCPTKSILHIKLMCPTIN